MSRTTHMVIPDCLREASDSRSKLMFAYFNSFFFDGGGIKLTTPGEHEPQPCKDCTHCPLLSRNHDVDAFMRCYEGEVGGVYRAIRLTDYVLGSDCPHFARKRNNADTALKTLREAVREHLGLCGGMEDDDEDGWSDEFLADAADDSVMTDAPEPVANDDDSHPPSVENTEATTTANADVLHVLSDLTAKLVAIRQKGCNGLVVENIGPEIFGRLLRLYDVRGICDVDAMAAYIDTTGDVLPPSGREAVVTSKGGPTTVTWQGSVHDTIIALLDAAREMAAKKE